MKRLLSIIMIIAFLAPASIVAAKKAEKPSDRAIMHNNKGVTALYAGDIDRALFEFKTATELSPKYVEAWNNLGIAYKYKGDLELAVDALKTAISLDKKYASPYNHLGTVYYNQGHYDDAVEQFKKAIKYNYKFSDAYYNMGLTYIAQSHATKDQSKLQNAISALTKATQINAEHPYAHNELAKVYQELGRYEEAIIRYKLALEINPKLTESWLALSTLYNKTGQTLKAQEALNHTMSLEGTGGDSASAHMNLGISYLNEKNYILALKEFDKTISIDPTNDKAYFNVAYTHFQIGIDLKNKGNSTQANESFGKAIQAYQSALALKPNFADAAFNLGYTYQTMKDIQNATDWYKKTLDIDPNYPRAMYALGTIYEVQGDSTNAKKYYCELIKLKPKDMSTELERLGNQVKTWGGCK